MWTRRGILLGALLLLGGCVLPLDIDVDADAWRASDEVRGSGRVVTEPRAVAGFDAVRASGVGRVLIERTGREVLTITAEDNILPHLWASVEGGTLVLGPRPGVGLSPTRDIVYRLEVVDLGRIEGSGAVSFDARLDEQDELEVSLSGVCAAEVTGAVDRLGVTLSGVTGFGGLGLESARARIVASGVSWANLWVTEHLEAWASGVSTIRYAGDPVVYAHTSGSSSVGRY